jgi:hypothetical protein
MTVEETYDSKIIQNYLTKRDHMLNKHTRVLQTRDDFRFPSNYKIDPNKNYISKFHEHLTKSLKRQNPLPQQGKIRSSEDKIET